MFPAPSIHERRKLGQGFNGSITVRRALFPAKLSGTVCGNELLNIAITVRVLGASGFIHLDFSIDFLFSN